MDLDVFFDVYEFGVYVGENMQVVHRDSKSRSEGASSLRLKDEEFTMFRLEDLVAAEVEVSSLGKGKRCFPGSDCVYDLCILLT